MPNRASVEDDHPTTAVIQPTGPVLTSFLRSTEEVAMDRAADTAAEATVTTQLAQGSRCSGLGHYTAPQSGNPGDPGDPGDDQDDDYLDADDSIYRRRAK